MYLYQKIEALHHGLPTLLEVLHGIYVSIIEILFQKHYFYNIINLFSGMKQKLFFQMTVFTAFTSVQIELTICRKAGSIAIIILKDVLDLFRIIQKQ